MLSILQIRIGMANIRQGYVNIKNPLYVTRDLGVGLAHSLVSVCK
jgi:hypothetical protein